MSRSQLLKSVLDAIPGKRRLGLYRFLPVFFLMGAALEFSMINWRVGNSHTRDGEINFYNTYKRRRAEETAKFIHDAKNFPGHISPPSSSSS